MHEVLYNCTESQMYTYDGCFSTRQDHELVLAAVWLPGILAWTIMCHEVTGGKALQQ